MSLLYCGNICGTGLNAELGEAIGLIPGNPILGLICTEGGPCNVITCTLNTFKNYPLHEKSHWQIFVLI